MYGNQNKPEMKPYANIEQLILSELDLEKQMTFHKVKGILEEYKTKVIDPKKKDFFFQGETREKILKFSSQLSNELMSKKEDITISNNILFSLVRNVLEDATLPEKTENFTFDTTDGYIAKRIQEEFSVSGKN